MLTYDAYTGWAALDSLLKVPSSKIKEGIMYRVATCRACGYALEVLRLLALLVQTYKY
jgi:hypothetical protein